jgi:hypothetical protein
MLVKGISRGDLEATVEIASGTLGNRLELYAMYPANRRRSAWRFRACLVRVRVGMVLYALSYEKDISN